MEKLFFYFLLFRLIRKKKKERKGKKIKKQKKDEHFYGKLWEKASYLIAKKGILTLLQKKYCYVLY